jgi:RNA polymerase sigma-70 factor, ECF subfamily
MSWFDVMRRLENEDRRALDELCALIRHKLSRMRGRNPLLHAEDIVQDTLICLLRAWRRGSIREERCFEGFVSTLAARRLADAWHRHARPGAPDCVGDPEQAADEAEGLSEEARRGIALEVTRALDRLDAAQQQALVAVYLEGQTYLEASQRFRLPLGSFKRKLGDGMRRMRAELA